MDIGFRVELPADRMPGATEAMAFTDSCKHMECLSRMRLVFSDFVYLCNAGYPS